ncbi:hypothetical protein NLG97_g4702 [Lecanicillium saksenae]|uniref:Uncharacterized protein n=1 Tax=Lecanicillium saksenae TaxID=468837 RepID=A0ACC1QXS6_9HYPO|nr:hypothetical protein NLG97_g4702 [Lecanicillium saksenae]
MLSVGRPVESAPFPPGNRHGISNTLFHEGKFSWDPPKQSPEVTIRPGGYPSPPMSGSPPFESARSARDLSSSGSSPHHIMPTDASQARWQIEQQIGGSITHHRGLLPLSNTYPQETPRAPHTRRRSEHRLPPLLTYNTPESVNSLHGTPRQPYVSPAPSITHQNSASQLRTSAPESSTRATSPRSQRKTKGHVASACVSHGKEDTCVDVRHKKRGRPRLRDDRESRMDAARFPHAADASARRASNIRPASMGQPMFYNSPGSAAPSAPGSEFTSPETPGHRYLPRVFSADATYRGERQSLQPVEEPVVYMRTNMEIVKASSSFLEAVGITGFAGRRIFDIVVPETSETMKELCTALNTEQKRKEPTYLPPIFDKGDDAARALSFAPEIVSRIEFNHQAYATFRAHDGQPRSYPIRLGLLKEGSFFFIAALLSVQSRLLYQPAAPQPRHAGHTLPRASLMYGTPTPMDAAHRRFSDGTSALRRQIGMPAQATPQRTSPTGTYQSIYSPSPHTGDYNRPSPLQIPRSELGTPLLSHPSESHREVFVRVKIITFELYACHAARGPVRTWLIRVNTVMVDVMDVDTVSGTKRKADTDTDEPAPPRRIRALDIDVVNKIAAGEIIVAPVHALKELLENAIDAGSTALEVLVKDGGLKLLQITDNGSGIQKDDLAILCERHTTSKIVAFEDLTAISTYGFRGEALASISHIAHLTVTTKTKDSPLAWRAHYLDGKLVPSKPGQPAEPKGVAGRPGTQIAVEDLFFSIPTRRRAFRSYADEFNKIIDMVGRYAIHSTGVGFTCKKAGESSTSLSIPAAASAVDRVRQIYGGGVANELVEVNAADERWGFKASALMTNANYHIKKTTLVLFINHRAVESSNIKKAVEQVYSAFLPKGGHPFVYLSLDIDPARVDVNVHPTKKEVHFLNEDEIIQDICNEITEALTAVDTSRTFKTQTLIPGAQPVHSAKDGESPVDTVLASGKRVRRNSNDLVRTDTAERKITSMFTRTESGEASGSAGRTDEPMAAPEPVEYETVDREHVSCSLSSIKELRAEVRDNIHNELTEIFTTHTFVGIVDEQRRLAAIQGGVKLFLVDYGHTCFESS